MATCVTSGSCRMHIQIENIQFVCYVIVLQVVLGRLKMPIQENATTGKSQYLKMPVQEKGSTEAVGWKMPVQEKGSTETVGWKMPVQEKDCTKAVG